MSKPIFLKINVMRIDKSKLFPGKNGAQYLDAVMWEMDQPDQYGNTHRIVQSVSREERDRGVKGAIIGNGKYGGGQAPVAVPKAPGPKPDEDDASSGVPF